LEERQPSFWQNPQKYPDLKLILGSDSDDLTFEGGLADDCSVLEEQQVKTSKANIWVADFEFR